MKHGREDYNNRIVDLAALDPMAAAKLCGNARFMAPKAIEPTEPVFVLRAKDRFAPDAVRQWARLVHKANPEIAREAMAQADAMEKWQQQNVRKVPTLRGQPETPGELL